MKATDDVRTLLSQEEVDALLDESSSPAGEERADGDPPASARPRMIVASRRGPDARLLRARLQANGAVVDSLRDGLRILDLLRARSYGLVVTDAELWADRAALLVERTAEIEPPPVVAFFVERSTARSSLPVGATVIPCPIPAGRVELTARELVAAAGATDRSSGVVAALDRAQPESEAEGETSWLRFFLESQRALSRGGGRATLRRSIATLARDVLGARAVGVTTTSAHGFERLVVAEDADAAAHFDVGDRAELSARDRRDAIVIDECGETLEISELPSAVRALALDYRNDLRALVERIARADGTR